MRKTKDTYLGCLLAVCISFVINTCIFFSLSNPGWVYQVGLLPMPTPHYQPMSGTAYVVGAHSFSDPVLISSPSKWVNAGTEVTILGAEWYYMGKHSGVACYLYRVQLPYGTEPKWLTQDDLTQTPGAALSRDQVCDPSRYPDHLPLLGTGWERTNVGPYRNVTPGWGYVNVGEGYGAILFPFAAPSGYYTYGDPILRQGAAVEVSESQWYSRSSDEGCYFYHVRDPESGTEGWLPEDVLSPDLSQSPPQYCFVFTDRDQMIKRLPSQSQE